MWSIGFTGIIEKLQKERDLSIRQIEIQSGLSNGSLGKSLGNGNVTVKSLEKILNSFPEAKAWIIAELEINDTKAAEPRETYEKKEIEGLKREIAAMEKAIESKEQLIFELKYQLEQARKSVPIKGQDSKG
jgi:hypothetical protein